jgi:glycosyltransferase involved in cell wall biosynthesis
LVIVGEKDGKTASTGNFVAHNIRFTGKVSNEQLSLLYQSADLFVMPSLGEGFGLPIVEATHFNCPVISSDIEVFRELDCSEAYFDPNSVKDIANCLTSTLAGPNRKNRKPNRHSWGNVIANLEEILDAKGRAVDSKNI